MTWTLQKPRSLIVGVFDAVPGAASIIDRLLEAKLQLSLLCSEGTAARHLSVASSGPEPEAGTMLGLGFARLARNLSPVSPLGAPACGLVATGVLKAALITSGIGSGRGLIHALTGLGIEPEVSTQIAERVAQGGLIVAARVDDLDRPGQQAAARLERDAALSLRLQTAQTPTGTHLVARRATGGNSRAP